MLLADLPEEAVLLNVNVPNCPRGELAGWRRTTIELVPTRAFNSAWLEPIDGAPDSYRTIVEWSDMVDLPPETDGGAVERGEVSITWLTPMVPAEPSATGAHAAEARLTAWLVQR